MTRNGIVRSSLRSLVLRAERGGAFSRTIRDLFRTFHGVDVGLYTVGPCHVPPGNLLPGTTVGRYCSIYYTVRALSHDRPWNSRLLHDLYGDEALDDSPAAPGAGTPAGLRIGNDVFMGHNVIILPSVREVGDGAVIGAGSVVQSCVPPYAIVTGNPARVVKFRFSKPRIAELLESKWWNKSLAELGRSIDEFRVPLEGGPLR
ncbi:MAG: CatB-related O-acetyltransferase [Verrucomicrobiae bacterium]|nr:CatB-related O-acetyltransferase [Verrucomicrobiae bacterium]